MTKIQDDNLGSAGERGTKIDEHQLAKYLHAGYLPTIGIECHVQLNTATKLFSAADNDAREAAPNSKISAIDYALPGMLPVLNREAVAKAARAGKALHSRIANESRFDRKHYFYPDLPKGYQISQMYHPVIIGGFVDLPSRKNSQNADDEIREKAFEVTNRGAIFHLNNYIREFNFPEKIDNLTLKNHFHTSLFLQTLTDDEVEKVREICDEFEPIFANNFPKLTGEFLFAKDENQQTIIAKIKNPELENWQKKIREILPNANFAIPHTTLYLRDVEKLGIALDETNFAKLTSKIDEKTDEILQKVFAKNDENNSRNIAQPAPETAIRIHHAHLEEDAGKLTHFADHSLVDLNRAGTPLIEIVSEPDIHSAAEAREYAEELHGLMTFAGVTFGDLYYGNMRFDVNTSVAKIAQPGEKLTEAEFAKRVRETPLGTRTEIKNLNSFRAVEKAVEYEISRQIEILESGEKVDQETRGWNDATGQTTVQRSKENAQDYRYMPDADIPPVVLTDAEIANWQADMPLLPPDFREKFRVLNVDDSVVAVLLRDAQIANLIAQILDNSEIGFAKNIVNLFVSTLPAEEEIRENPDENSGENDDEISRETPSASSSDLIQGSKKSDEIREKNSQSGDENNGKNPAENHFAKTFPSAEHLIKLAKMFANKQISSTAEKEIFAEMLASDDDPEKIARAKNLLQNSNTDEIAKIVDEVLASPACAKAALDFKNGQEKVLGFLVGQVMKVSKGSANPALAQKVIREKLGK